MLFHAYSANANMDWYSRVVSDGVFCSATLYEQVKLVW